nr:MAG TPA: Transcription factor p53, p53, oligomerization domain, tetramerizaiton [Caudoviricetes sp.]
MLGGNSVPTVFQVAFQPRGGYLKPIRCKTKPCMFR